jgi:hypothetical protein
MSKITKKQENLATRRNFGGGGCRRLLETHIHVSVRIKGATKDANGAAAAGGMGPQVARRGICIVCRCAEYRIKIKWYEGESHGGCVTSCLDCWASHHLHIHVHLLAERSYVLVHADNLSLRHSV